MYLCKNVLLFSAIFHFYPVGTEDAEQCEGFTSKVKVSTSQVLNIQIKSPMVVVSVLSLAACQPD